MKHTVQTFFSLFGVLFINVFSSVILSRGLTVDDRGIYLGVTMWGGFIQGLCDIGIYGATVYLWGKSREGEKKDLFSTLLIWALATGIACVFIAAALGDWMLKARLDEAETIAAYIFFLSTLFGPVTTMVTGVLAAEQRFTWINLTRVGLPAALTILWFVYYLTGTLSIALCLVTTAVLPFVTLLPLLWQVRDYFRRVGKFRRKLFYQAVWYGLRGYGGSIVHVLGNNSSQLLLFTLTPSALAYYQTAGSAAGVLWAVPKAIGTTSFPALVKTNPEQLHGNVTRILRLTLLATMLGMFALGLAVPVLIPLLFGAPYAAAVLPALILIPNALFGGLSDVFGNALSSTGRTFHATVANAGNVGAMLLALALTIQPLGLIGAALSSLAGFIVSLAVRGVWYSLSVQRIGAREMIPTQHEVREWIRAGLRAVRGAHLLRRRKSSVLSVKKG